MDSPSYVTKEIRIFILYFVTCTSSSSVVPISALGLLSLPASLPWNAGVELIVLVTQSLLESTGGKRCTPSSLLIITKDNSICFSKYWITVLGDASYYYSWAIFNAVRPLMSFSIILEAEYWPTKNCTLTASDALLECTGTVQREEPTTIILFWNRSRIFLEQKHQHFE